MLFEPADFVPRLSLSVVLIVAVGNQWSLTTVAVQFLAKKKTTTNEQVLIKFSPITFFSVQVSQLEKKSFRLKVKAGTLSVCLSKYFIPVGIKAVFLSGPSPSSEPLTCLSRDLKSVALILCHTVIWTFCLSWFLLWHLALWKSEGGSEICKWGRSDDGDEVAMPKRK